MLSPSAMRKAATAPPRAPNQALPAVVGCAGRRWRWTQLVRSTGVPKIGRGPKMPSQGGSGGAGGDSGVAELPGETNPDGVGVGVCQVDRLGEDGCHPPGDEGSCPLTSGGYWPDGKGSCPLTDGVMKVEPGSRFKG